MKAQFSFLDIHIDSVCVQLSADYSCTCSVLKSYCQFLRLPVDKSSLHLVHVGIWWKQVG